MDIGKIKNPFKKEVVETPVAAPESHIGESQAIDQQVQQIESAQLSAPQQEQQVPPQQPVEPAEIQQETAPAKVPEVTIEEVLKNHESRLQRIEYHLRL